jgi:ADP-ribose pyrophosphatase YjhB (NUDIX family)
MDVLARESRRTMTQSARVRPTRPVVGIGAVIVDRGRVVLVKRVHPPLAGQWSLPGGAVELGEALADAVRREVLEETGLVVDVGPVVEVIERVERDARGSVEYHYVVVDYKCRPIGGSLAPGSDAGDVRWAALDDLASLRVTDLAIAVVKKALDLRWPPERS